MLAPVLQGRNDRTPDANRSQPRAGAIACADSACGDAGSRSATAKWARSTDTHAAATLCGSPSTNSAAR